MESKPCVVELFLRSDESGRNSDFLSSARVRQASASTVRRWVGESSSVGVSGSGGHSSVARACFSLANRQGRAALATRGAVFYFRFRSIAHTIFLFHCLDRGFTLTGLAPMRSKRSGDLERRRIRVAVGKEHFPSVKSFSKFPMVGLVPNRDACERRFTPALHRLVRQLRSSSIDPTNVSWSKSSEEGSERFFFWTLGSSARVRQASASTVRPSAFEIKVAGVPFSLFDTVL